MSAANKNETAAVHCYNGYEQCVERNRIFDHWRLAGAEHPKGVPGDFPVFHRAESQDVYDCVSFDVDCIFFCVKEEKNRRVYLCDWVK